MKHYVGQRVRIDCPFSTMHGREGIIKHTNALGKHKGVPYFGCEVDLGFPNPRARDGRFVYEPHELIPLTGPGRALVSWQSMRDLGLPVPEDIRSKLNA